MPSALVFHAQSNALVNAIGVGDRGQLRVTLPLNVGFGYILRRAMATMKGDNQDGDRWEGARMIMFPTVDESGAQEEVELEYPMGLRILMRAGTQNHAAYQFGASNNSNFAAGFDDGGGLNALSAPASILYGGGTDPIFELWTESASIGTASLSYVFEWLIFNIEQTVNSGLYWNLPTRQ